MQIYNILNIYSLPRKNLIIHCKLIHTFETLLLCFLNISVSNTEAFIFVVFFFFFLQFAYVSKKLFAAIKYTQVPARAAL